MEKIFRNFEIEKDLDWTNGIQIADLRNELCRLEKAGATHIEIEPYNSYDCAYVDIIAYANREETDEECKQRLEKEQKHKDDIERMELEQLRKLKEKYNS